MKFFIWIINTCGASCRWFDLVLIRSIAVIFALLGGLYTVVWLKWALDLSERHPRAWLDPYMIIGVPIFIFAVGIFFLYRVCLLVIGSGCILLTVLYFFSFCSEGNTSLITLKALYILLPAIAAYRLLYVSLHSKHFPST
jgi:hypothetical protein